MLTSEVLDKAADEIERRGWTIGNSGFTKTTGPLCIEGAILAVDGQTFFGIDPLEFWTCPAYRAVGDYLGRDLTIECTPRQPLWRWNDDAGRTQAEVIEVLRAAAMVERTREAAAERVSA